MKTPARKIRPTRGRHYRSKIGSSKSLRIIHAESLLERDYVRLCNFDPTVAKIYYQPIGIQYHYDSRKRRYFPDYMIITRDNRHFLVEVKLKEFVGSNLNRAKLGYFESFLPLLNSPDFLEHRHWIECIITSLSRQMENEKKRDFLED